jgi:hypothetical protein
LNKSHYKSEIQKKNLSILLYFWLQNGNQIYEYDDFIYFYFLSLLAPEHGKAPKSLSLSVLDKISPVKKRMLTTST